jgi:phosphate transport system permease protein
MTAASGAAATSRRATGRRDLVPGGDAVAHLVALAFGLTVLILVGLLAYELFQSSSLSRERFGWRFLLVETWDPVAEEFGATAFIYGTLVTSAVALLIAVPLGVGAALFLAELAPRSVSNGLGLLIELLAAVPSVIYGLIAVSVLVPLMRSHIQPAIQAVTGSFPLFAGPAYGVGFLTAGIVLAVMVVPFIVSVLREVLLAVPREQREAALALGSTRWESTWHVVLPYARSGLYGAVFLALGRALGETMAVTMVIGNRPEIAASLFAPGYTMAAVIANEFTEATGDLYLHALVEVGLVLFVLTMVVNGLARLLILATTRRAAAA